MEDRTKKNEAALMVFVTEKKVHWKKKKSGRMFEKGVVVFEASN